MAPRNPSPMKSLKREATKGKQLMRTATTKGGAMLANLNRRRENASSLISSMFDDSLGHVRAVYCVAFHPDGHHVVTGGADNEAKLWNISTHLCLYSFTGHEQWVMSCAVSHTPNDDCELMVATGCDDRVVRVWTHRKFDDETTLGEGWHMTHEVPGNPPTSTIAQARLPHPPLPRALCSLGGSTMRCHLTPPACTLSSSHRRTTPC